MDLKDNINLETLKAEELEYMHDEMHTYFNQLLAGNLKGWTFGKIHRAHSAIVSALIRAGGTHVAPIDKLDNIQILEEKIEPIKLKKGKSIIAKVLAVNRVKEESDVFYYNMGIEGNIPIGETSKTKIQASAGDKLEVILEGLNQYMNPNTAKIWFSWEGSHVLAKSSKEITSITEAKKIVDSTSGQVEEKEMPKIQSSELEEVEEILVEDINDFNPSKSSDEELMRDHRITHTWYS